MCWAFYYWMEEERSWRSIDGPTMRPILMVLDGGGSCLQPIYRARCRCIVLRLSVQHFILLCENHIKITVTKMCTCGFKISPDFNGVIRCSVKDWLRFHGWWGIVSLGCHNENWRTKMEIGEDRAWKKWWNPEYTYVLELRRKLYQRKSLIRYTYTSLVMHYKICTYVYGIVPYR